MKLSTSCWLCAFVAATFLFIIPSANAQSSPGITTQPASQTVVAGSNGSFSVVATGQTPLSYQWSRNGSTLTDSAHVVGSTNSALTIVSALPGDVGSYAVVVANRHGAVTSSDATLTVWVRATISQQPLSVTVGVGSNAVFSAGSSGTAPLTNRWFFNGVPLTDDGRITGATSTSLTVASVTANDAGSYRLAVSNVAGTATSASATLGVGYPAMIVTEPQSQTVLTSNSMTLSAVASGTAPILYQWYKDGVALADDGNITGSQSNVLSIASADLSHQGYYHVAVTNAFGGMFGSLAFVTVIQPPSITNQPPDRTVLAGSTSMFYLGFQGTPPLTFQWLLNGVPLTNDAHFIQVDGVPLIITNVLSPLQGSYSVVISNAGGTVTSSNAVLTVQVIPPSFQTEPVGTNAVVGTTVTFSATVSGTPLLTNQWYFNGQPLLDDGRIVGSATTSLTISNAQLSDAGSYYLAASNDAGVTNSDVAVLAVGYPPVVTSDPATQTVVAGTSAALSVTATGSDPLSYQWYLGASVLSDDAHRSGSTNATLSLNPVQTGDAGGYRVVVSNQYGVVSSASATMAVILRPSFSPQPIGHSAPPGLATTFTGNATGTTPISFQWQFNGTDIPDATTTTYSISNISMANFGTYNLVASNVAGVTVSSNALLTLGPVACWGRNAQGQCLPPAGLTNVVGIAGGLDYSASIQSDGSLTSWISYVKQPSPPVTNAVALSAGFGDTGAVLRADGTIAAWGILIPAGISNVTAIAMSSGPSLFLRSDGTVGAIPLGSSPAGLSKIVAIAAGANNQNLALRSDGTVMEWSSSLAGAGTSAITNPMPGLSNVVAIAAGYRQCLALKSDGRIVSWGTGPATNIPAILTNASAPRVVAIAASGYPQGQSHSLAVLTNGTVISWGDNLYGETNVPSGLSNVVAVAGGAYHSLALVSDGRPLILQSPVGGTAFSGRDFKFKAQVVGNAPLSYQWTFNGTNIPGATNATLTVTNIQLASAGTYQLSVTNSVGNASSVPLPVQVTDSVPFLTTQPKSQTAYVGQRFVWSVPVSGSGPVSLQWRIATNPSALQLEWQDIPGATNEDLVLDPVRSSDASVYNLVASNSFGTVTSSNVTLTIRQVVAWGDNTFGQTNVPVSMTNAVAIAANATETLALKDDGTVAFWGNAGINVLPNWSNIVEVAEGSQNVRFGLRSDGVPMVWGISGVFSNAIANLTNILALEGDVSGATFLRTDGTLARVGFNGVVFVPPGGSNVVAITHDSTGFIALHADGTAAVFQGVTAPPATTNILAAAAGQYAGVFLRRDSTIVDWGLMPTNRLTNIIDVAAMDNGSKMAVRSDGTVVAWAGTVAATNPPPDLGGVIAADAGSTFFVTLLAPRPFPPVFLPDALDTTALVVSSRSSPQWYGQTQITRDGKHAARSAQIASSTASSMRMLVTNGPVNVSFWWKVSSETNHDFLTSSVGGVPQAAISGEVDWQQVTFTVPAGPQMVVWTYSKDATGTAGMDAGFVDQLTFTPIAPSITSQPVSQTVLGGPAVSLSAGVYGTAPLSYRWFNASSSTPVSTSSVFTINPTYRSSSGTYYVIVTNSVGSVTSSNAVLTVHVPQRIGLPLLQPDGTFVLTSQDADQSLFANTTDVSGFQAQYSSNLVDWWPVLAPLSVTNGVMQVNDSEATNAPVRFYRIIEGW